MTQHQNKRFYVHKATKMDIDAPKVKPDFYALVWKSGNITQYIKKGSFASMISEEKKQKKDPKWIGGKFNIIPFE